MKSRSPYSPNRLKKLNGAPPGTRTPNLLIKSQRGRISWIDLSNYNLGNGLFVNRILDFVTAHATVRFERREIDRTNTSGQHFLVETDYVTALVGLRAHFGSRRQSIIEGGFASEFRKRREQIDDMSNTTHHDDHRFYFSFEYAFDDSKRLRITEAFELDGEDIGDLRIHDHGFLQMIFGF